MDLSFRITGLDRARRRVIYNGKVLQPSQARRFGRVFPLGRVTQVAESALCERFN